MLSVAKIGWSCSEARGRSWDGCFVLYPLVLCLFMLFSVPVYAAEITTPGEVLLSGGHLAMDVSVSYTDDDNNNNNLLIEWIEGGGQWTELLGSVSLDHAPSPYLYKITSLANQSTYQVRVTFKDGDMTEDISIIAGAKPFNPLVHSSLSTASGKWTDSGGWGIIGGKYGEFSCRTCHQKGSRNAKQVKGALEVTDSAASSDELPIEVDAGVVVLDSLASGTSNLGDDRRDPADLSTNVCEACHSQTNYHRYDTVTPVQPGGLDHYNEGDCIKCHNHQEGFTAGCSGCHDNPPEWNSHPAHLEDGRMLAKLTCSTCHQGTNHLNDNSEIGFDSGDTRLSGAVYDDTNQTSRYTEASGYEATPAYVSCQSLYCHSNGNPLGGAIAYTDPTWGGTVMDCVSCHDDAGDDTVLSSHHPKHVGALYNFSCVKCHATTVSDSSTISDNTLHVNEQKDVSFSNSGAYSVDKECSNTYCHDDGQDNGVSNPNVPVEWDVAHTSTCLSCHGDLVDEDPDLAADSYKMTSGAHDVLVSTKWVREYPCEYCHFNTTNNAGAIKSGGYHVNEQVDIAIDPQWKIAGRPDPSYDSENNNCLNLYCHSDGTTVNPVVADIDWVNGASHCDSCHGHQGACIDCHDGSDGKPVLTEWPQGKEWMNSTPMYANTGPGTDRANSHVRHLQTNFSCENCHALTIRTEDGTCDTCHIDGQAPAGAMDENGHIDPVYHVNKVKDVVFKDGGTYDPVTKRCSSTVCHTGSDPQWGDSASGQVLCLSCHGTTEADIDDFDAFNGAQAKINLTEWASSGHGRPAADGNYTSGNPPADFPGNPCWYCHDNEALHMDAENPYRLKMHPQFEKRFAKECVYCHMQGLDDECHACHNSDDSLATQISSIAEAGHDGAESCTASCHDTDAEQHKTGAGVWTVEQQADIKNQYMMMGVCLQCHDNNDSDRCYSCHSWEGDPAEDPYLLGYDPGTGFITGSSKASSTHFGHKHWEGYLVDGRWRGGKFCWDCHDPHGDSNIYMVQDQIATETEGLYGKPVSKADVVFTKTTSGVDYAKSSAPYNGICNVCHTNTEHFSDVYGDGHRASRRCTDCHEHGFGVGHASGKACNECHKSKPIPNHIGFGLPRDCIKCHDGAIKLRMDIMRQFKGQSHHVQGIETSNEHCYECHWEATPEGLIDNDYHAGYNYKTYEAVANAPSDLVIYGAETRPTTYELGVTAVTFDATEIGTANERTEVAKVSQHCIGCHSDQNNDAIPFDDCMTPSQYAWDRQSIAARYSQAGTTNWGKYPGANAAKKNIQKAFSAHGNAVENGGGWSATTGQDETIPNTRAGGQNVQCFDCHSSHGSYTSGVTSSYQTFDGSYGGGNLKETQAGKGGYGATYRAAGVADGNINQMSPAAAQCFDCHETQNAGSMPWGYESTFGATAPIRGYYDSARFGGGGSGPQIRFPYRAARTLMGGHLKASSPLITAATGTINGSCTACHDPHGVSPTLGIADQAYAVPLLKGTWLTSPFKEDSPQQSLSMNRESSTVYPGRKTFGTIDGETDGPANKLNESDTQFAGLCLRCHPKSSLTDGINKNTDFKSLDRVHETVAGWGTNNEHSYSCSKCHQVHAAGLPRLMRTNCLDPNHRGGQVSGGSPTQGWVDDMGFPRLFETWGDPVWPACHETETGSWNNQQWNEVTPW